MLFVANADANNLAVFNVADRDDGQAARLHPDRLVSDRRSASTPHDKTLYVANGKGLTLEGQPQRPEPAAAASRGNLDEYIGGAVPAARSAILDCPTPEQMATLHASTAYACSPLQTGRRGRAPTASRPDNPIPAKVGDPSPIKYCIYIIKENRTYDQVFGDMHGGQRRPEPVPLPRER